MNARLARGKFIAALPGHALLPGRFAFYFFAQAKFLIPQTARSINGADLSAIYFFWTYVFRRAAPRYHLAYLARMRFVFASAD